MRVVRSRSGMPVRLVAAALVTGSLLATTPGHAAAQYFGRNKVQYESFDFRALHTPHFDIYFYPAESTAVADAARMAERWYARHSRTLNDEFSRRSIILYADAPDFQQTNVIGGFISQGTGGVTEPIRSRAVLPFTGVYADFDHVLGHELVHVFQFDIASGTQGGQTGLNRLPLWLIEGMAEYLSIGRDDPNTAMWLRDAALRNDLPTIKQLGTDPRYFPYRYGQALWAYIGGRWGDDAVSRLYRAAIKSGFEPALHSVLGVTSDTLSAQWHAAIRNTYLPAMTGRTPPKETGARVLSQVKDPGAMDVAPALSPDGRYVAFFTSRALLDIGLYVADTRTGKVVKKLTSLNTDQHFDAVSFINSAGAWSPDGRKFAFVTFANGDNEIAIFDVESRDIERQLRFKEIGGITDVAWGPKNQLVFSGMAGGISDLYLYDLGSGRLRALTHDRYADLQPTWSPDGHTLAFVTDSGPGTDLTELRYGPTRIALLDLTTGATRLVPVFDGAKHINPQFTPDGRDLYFISDRGGYDDVYRVTLATGEVRQVTRTATGVSGITALSPALSVARQSGLVVFSVFENGGYALHRLEPAEATGTLLARAGGATVNDTSTVAGILPPTNLPGGGPITQRVHDPSTGLLAPAQFPTSPYHPSLSLEAIGSPGVGIGVATGPLGGVVAGGGIAAYFTDLLGNDVVGAQIAGGGDIRNFGGQLLYQNIAHRWNWGVGASHTPYLTGLFQITDTTVNIQGQTFDALNFEQAIQRTYYDQALVMAQYPLSMTRRFEFSGGFTHIGFGGDLERVTVVGDQVVDARRTDLPHEPGVNYWQGTAAFVGDYSYFGFTSPIAGGRYRFEVTPTFGDLTLQNVLADYRRYFFLRPITLAFRGLHVGRYGRDSEDQRLFPLYVGDPQLVRGYEATSFGGSECRDAPPNSGQCPAFDRLIGSRLAVANLEVRIPLFGTDQLGLINFPYLPTEIAPFVDAGVAWTSDESPDFEFVRRSAARIPVVSTGVSARVNVLGYLVLELYYAYPFQRPDKGGHFGFEIAPGW